MKVSYSYSGPASGGTRVDWFISGWNDMLSKAMCPCMGGMDKMIGPDFDKGLAQPKHASEATRESSRALLCRAS